MEQARVIATASFSYKCYAATSMNMMIRVVHGTVAKNEV